MPQPACGQCVMRKPHLRENTRCLRRARLIRRQESKRGQGSHGAQDQPTGNIAQRCTCVGRLAPANKRIASGQSQHRDQIAKVHEHRRCGENEGAPIAPLREGGQRGQTQHTEQTRLKHVTDDVLLGDARLQIPGPVSIEHLRDGVAPQPDLRKRENK